MSIDDLIAMIDYDSPSLLAMLRPLLLDPNVSRDLVLDVYRSRIAVIALGLRPTDTQFALAFALHASLDRGLLVLAPQP